MKKILFIITFFLYINNSFINVAYAQNRDATIGAGISTGLSIPSLVTRPYFLQMYTDDYIIGVEHGNAKFDSFKDDNLTISDFDYKYSGLYVRMFPTFWSNENWNIIQSVHQRLFKFNAKTEIRGNDEFDYSHTDFKSEVYTYSLGLGYQRILSLGNFGGIIIGFDFFIRSFTISDKYTVDVSGAPSDIEKQAMEKDAKEFIDEVNDLSNYAFGIISLGYSF